MLNLKYIAGNTKRHAIRCSKRILNQNKIPIINYAVENKNKKEENYHEHVTLSNSLDEKYKVAIKLSSFDFDYTLIDKLIDKFKRKNIQVIIDAEKNKDYLLYKDICNQLIFSHNQHKVNVVKTYQMYRKDELELLKKEYNMFMDNDIYFGTKIVRGAYWKNECSQGHLFTNKNNTDKSYDGAVRFLTSNYNDKNYNILATHNCFSIVIGNCYNKLYHKNVFDFAHLLGMNNNSYNIISNMNNNIHVYVPYGPYSEMMPYLVRRIYENLDMLKYMIK
jgi:hypothetical protein